MENLKIKAKNLDQKNEIINIFILLGYKEDSSCTYNNDDLMGIHVYEDGEIQDVIDDDYEDDDHKEITLPQLRDLVVLKRNDVGDATKQLGAAVIWQRPTFTEEPTFVDDDCEQDTTPHNHYYINVSDVDEIDFYEIALRYNVTDPCIQHILKKCLAVGNRGHKDFHTDLKDIHDTAVRALRIHVG